MPKERMDLFVDQKTAGELRGVADEHDKRVAGVVDALVDLYIRDLDRLYQEQREAAERRRK